MGPSIDINKSIPGFDPGWNTSNLPLNGDIVVKIDTTTEPGKALITFESGKVIPVVLDTIQPELTTSGYSNTPKNKQEAIDQLVSLKVYLMDKISDKERAKLKEILEQLTEITKSKEVKASREPNNGTIIL